ncbi:MAG: cyclic nucleotide-binding domain-containing protein [Deltaproteobacteria bacterium]|nr:cyclic nucleotide-binding domain-containing protein [Deltaproteobacteria bacterium]
MYVKQADFFWGTSQIFVNQVMKISKKESWEKGYFLFREGNPANRFYILLKGRVRLSIGKAGQVVYIVSHAGEAFGWSSLIGYNSYSASAECMELVDLITFDKEKFQTILEEDPANGLLFFQGLAETLGNRLLQTYKMISDTSQFEKISSLGTGQFKKPNAAS